MSATDPRDLKPYIEQRADEARAAIEAGDTDPFVAFATELTLAFAESCGVEVREHAAPCSACRTPTFNLSGVCDVHE